MEQIKICHIYGDIMKDLYKKHLHKKLNIEFINPCSYEELIQDNINIEFRVIDKYGKRHIFIVPASIERDITKYILFNINPKLVYTRNIKIISYKKNR